MVSCLICIRCDAVRVELDMLMCEFVEWCWVWFCGVQSVCMQLRCVVCVLLCNGMVLRCVVFVMLCVCFVQGDVSSWDVSNVKSSEEMFRLATNFNVCFPVFLFFFC